MEGGGENIFFIITWSRLKTEHPFLLLFLRLCVHGKKKELGKTSFLFRGLEKGKKMVHGFVYCRNGLPTPGEKAWSNNGSIYAQYAQWFRRFRKKTFPDFARIAIRRCDGDALLD